MTSTKHCCVPGCNKREEEKECLHGFPNPKRDRKRFNTWLYAVGGEIIGLENETIYKYRRVCRSHFEEKYRCRNDRLSNIAIPTLNLPDKGKTSKESRDAATLLQLIDHTYYDSHGSGNAETLHKPTTPTSARHQVSAQGMCDCDFMLVGGEDWEPHYDNCRTVWERRHGKQCPRNNDGTLRLCNKNLLQLENDCIYHLGFDTKNFDLPVMFGDVKFVCMGGTKHRMRDFAKYIAKVLKINHCDFANMTKLSHRYAMYKVGPVLSVSHGIGIPSMTILLQEILKLLHYAKAKNPIIFRIGTSGGLNIPPGSVVISSWGMNGCLQKTYDIPVLGKLRQLPAIFDRRLSQEILSASQASFGTYVGGTMAADDFYRGQARLDGPFCDHTVDEKLAFLHTLAEHGVRNIEMEATAFAALANEAAVRAADVCVTLLDRLKGDQVTLDKETYAEYQLRPMIVVGKYIAKYYENKYKL